MSIQITIDERPLSVESGLTVLQAARQNGIEIPTLCDFPGLPSHGSCRMCIVEIQGRPNTPTACTTPVEEGMVVQTSTPKVRALRAELLQMLLSEHPSSCLFCPEKSHCDECMVTLRKAGVTTGCRSCAKDGQCVFQKMVAESDLTGVGYPTRYRMLPVEKYDPFYDRDYNLCVLCGRCIRACAELHFANVLTYTSRGTQTVVGTAFHHTHFEAGCSFCGACLEVCPTGALSEKTRKWDGTPDGETASTCPLCSLGCSIRLLTKNGRVIGTLPSGQPGYGSLCVKGRFGITELVNHPTRLSRPQKREGDGRLAIDWEEAIQAAAETIAACAPGRAGMLISADSTSEDLYVARRFARAVLCGSFRTTLEARYGAGLAPVARLLRQSQPLDILAEAGTILCLGLDGKYAQSVVEVALHRAKNRGAQLLTVHSRPHSLSPYADAWLQPEPGKETAAVLELAGRVEKALPAGPGSPVEQVAQVLRAAAAPVVIVGPDFLSHPDNRALLEAVELLISNCGARVIVAAEQANLAGALMLGEPTAETVDPQNLDVLYLIGAAVPENLPAAALVLYQNIYPPDGECAADLLLPAAAFSEVDGTLFDYTGRARPLQPAVLPPGHALPTWEILCRIAQKLGVPGFDYPNAAAIRAEMRGMLPDGRVDWDQAPELADPGSSGSPSLGEHDYMGFPLSRWVEGFRMVDKI